MVSISCLGKGNSLRVKKVKLAHTRLPSIGFRSWSRVLCSQPAGDMSHKPGSRLPLLSARPAVTLAALKKAATSFAAWWMRHGGCEQLRLLPDSITTAICTQALLRLSPACYRATLREVKKFLQSEICVSCFRLHFGYGFDSDICTFVGMYCRVWSFDGLWPWSATPALAQSVVNIGNSSALYLHLDDLLWDANVYCCCI